MSSLDLVNFAANENHVKFRSTLNEMLYSRLSDVIREKTIDTIAEIFQTERVEDSISLEEYVTNVIHEAEERLGTQFTTEEITESATHIIALLEKAKEEDEKEEEDEEEEEEEEDEEEEDEEEEDEEEEDEEEEAEDEDAPAEDAEKKAAKGKAPTVVHVDMQGAHKTTINKNGKGKKK